jgi:hypothetical protein
MKRAVLLLVLGACGAVQVAPVKVEPIHVTVDINVHDATPAKKPQPGHAAGVESP